MITNFVDIMQSEFQYLYEKARHFCDYQERSIGEVKEKMVSWSARPAVIEQVILQLERENYLDEDRFVRAYALGKLRNNKWGRNKIMQGLRQKGVPDLIIQIGLQEIEGAEYIQVLKEVLSSKKVDETDLFRKNAKMAAYAIQKGFQPSLVWEILQGKQ
jgi:regulatory protein